MPIFEFKCMDCDEYMEMLVMNKQEEVEMVCSHCGSGNLERILSTTKSHRHRRRIGSAFQFRGPHPDADLQFGFV
jgi:putative FmdB family regulatory protein